MATKKGDPNLKLSLETVKEFLIKHDGKVKQNDLINHFRCELTNPTTKVRARQEFKDILQLITALKTENGEKYILLTKQTQEHLQTSVISRKAKRPLSIRKELSKSKLDYLQAPFSPGAPFEHYCDIDLSPRNSISFPLEGVEGNSVASDHVDTVSTLRETFASKINECSHHSLHVKDDEEELEDEIGLTDSIEVLPEEKEWMLASAHGNLQSLKRLSKKYPDIVKNKDFILGYTALHWAAKLGRPDIVKFIISSGVDIHSKSHGGYTPLHIASMSGKDEVILMLIDLGASIHTRDYSGKKPKDVVKDTVEDMVQRKLGRSLVINPGTVLQFGLAMKHHKKPRPSISTSDGDSPLSTPELARRAFRTVSVNAQMAFMRKKRKGSNKLKATDILHSPLTERANSAVFDDNIIPAINKIPFARQKSKSETFDEAAFNFHV